VRAGPGPIALMARLSLPKGPGRNLFGLERMDSQPELRITKVIRLGAIMHVDLCLCLQ
jgi:hypothetical protein